MPDDDTMLGQNLVDVRNEGRRDRPQWCSCGPERACEYADTDGRKILKELKAKGLLKRDRHHVYRRAGEAAGLQGDLPEGF